MAMRAASSSAHSAESRTKRRRWFALPRKDQRVPRIGEILVRRGVSSRRVLAEALLAQPASGLRIGELLVKRGALCQADLDAALREQKFRRVLVLVMALSGAFPSGLV